MSALTRQQLCATLSVSESTVRRWELEGMPSVEFAGAKRKLYSMREVRLWLKRKDPGKAAAVMSPVPRNYYGANARAKTLNRMPSWADKRAMRRVYEEARRLTVLTGVEHQVDHIYPLLGQLVSGLHVEGNLQILTGQENGRKHNQFDIE